MTNMTCGKCNFHFKKAVLPRLCPFCGAECSVYEDEDATQILKDVDSMTA
jgi:rubrerythrin